MVIVSPTVSIPYPTNMENPSINPAFISPEVKSCRRFIIIGRKKRKARKKRIVTINRGEISPSPAFITGKVPPQISVTNINIASVLNRSLSFIVDW